MSSKALTAIVERLKERHKAGDPEVVQPKRMRKPKIVVIDSLSKATEEFIKLISKNRTLH